MTKPADAQFPLEDLFDKGILWMVNATIFHPRGFAMALSMDEDGQVTGWRLMGDGTEPWAFDMSPEKWPEGNHPNDRFKAFEAMLDELRPS